MDEEKKVPTEEALTTAPVTAPTNFWGNAKAISTAYKTAQGLASSDLIPQSYKGNPFSIMIAMEMATRTNFPLLMVMRNLYVIQGKPSWSGQFCTAVNVFHR